MNMKILVTGGAGFLGSHVAEYYANLGNEVICYDNLSRAELLKKEVNTLYNWNYLKNNFSNIKLIKGDIRDFKKLREVAKDVNVIIHAAAQTAVTTSLEEPRTDFEVNAIGTFNVLEAARLARTNPVIVYCSTNKVYGENVNKIKVMEKGSRYIFEDKFKNGVPETFPIDLCEHTPYGCSKLTGDLYVQDYGHLYGLKTGVFRMSCIYGTRQFGVEDQGWVAWFSIATVLGKPITIYGDGKQVRDVLYVDDLVKAFDSFVNSNFKQGVFNIGGGSDNTISLLELLDLLENLTDKRCDIKFSDWRLSDQKVYISNIEKAREKLGWKPEINQEDGVKRLVEWITVNEKIFRD
jgi:CDP-paratose 2-epimerase